MNMAVARRAILIIIGVLLAGAPLLLAPSNAFGTGLTVTYHKNALWTSAFVTTSWHGGAYSEDALDLGDSDCTATSGCNTAYFRSQGLGQYQVQYTLTNYGGSYCTGKVYTLNYYGNGVWNSLIRLNYVHIKNMRTSSSGTLNYYHDYAEWVGDVADTQNVNCAWSGPHLHYSRSTNYGVNVHNGAAGFGAYGSYVGADEVTFVGCQTSCP